jgi:hypothetical protein
MAETERLVAPVQVSPVQDRGARADTAGQAGRKRCERLVVEDRFDNLFTSQQAGRSLEMLTTQTEPGRSASSLLSTGLQ